MSSPAPSVEDLVPGTVIAERYRINGVLGVGSSGRVYSAEHVLLRKRVALKLLNRELLDNPTLIGRFEREAVAAGRIEHPNVAAAIDFGKLPDGRLFLVLEQVVGRNLRDELAAGPLPLARALHIARQIASAVAKAQSLEIVHRDLKPENVMLVDKGLDHDFVKVLDFGIARMPSSGDASAPLTRAGAVFGTPEYMAPEQALGQVVDSRADLYALGVVLFEMLAGVRPFTATGSVSLAATLSAPVPRFSERVPGLNVPAPVEELVQRLLAKDPAARFQRAAEIVDILGELLVPLRGRGPLLTPPVGSLIPDGPTAPEQGSAPIGAEPADAPTILAASNAKAERLATFMPGDPLPSFDLSAEGSAAAALPPPAAVNVLPKPVSLPPPPEPPTLLRVPSTSPPPAGNDSVKPSVANSAWQRDLARLFADLRAFLMRVPSAIGTRVLAAFRKSELFVEGARGGLPAPIVRGLKGVSSRVLVTVALLLGLIALTAGAVLVFARRAPRPVAQALPSAAPVASSLVVEAAPPEVPPPAESTPANDSWTRARSLLEQAGIQSRDHRDGEAMSALARALELHPTLRADPRVPGMVFQAAQSNARGPSETAFALLQGSLGARGAELMYRLALDKNTPEAARRRAEKWLRSDALESLAGGALSSAVKLRYADSCQQRHKLLQFAGSAGGQQTLDYLRELTVKSGCGVSGQDDCFPCLRSDHQLEDAIVQIERRLRP